MWNLLIVRGLTLVFTAITYFYDERDMLLDYFWEESMDVLIKSMFKPNKWTTLHEWLSYIYWFGIDYMDRKTSVKDFFEYRLQLFTDAGISLKEKTPNLIR